MVSPQAVLTFHAETGVTKNVNMRGKFGCLRFEPTTTPCPGDHETVGFLHPRIGGCTVDDEFAGVDVDVGYRGSDR